MDGDELGRLGLLLVFEAEVVGGGDIGALREGVENPTHIFGIVDMVGVVEHRGEDIELGHRVGEHGVFRQAQTVKF